MIDSPYSWKFKNEEKEKKKKENAKEGGWEGKG